MVATDIQEEWDVSLLSSKVALPSDCTFKYIGQWPSTVKFRSMVRNIVSFWCQWYPQASSIKTNTGSFSVAIAT